MVILSGEFDRFVNGTREVGFLMSNSGEGLGPVGVGVDLVLDPALVSRVAAAVVGCVVFVRLRVVVLGLPAMGDILGSDCRVERGCMSCRI